MISLKREEKMINLSRNQMKIREHLIERFLITQDWLDGVICFVLLLYSSLSLDHLLSCVQVLSSQVSSLALTHYKVT